jgi:hypothetical protein
MRRLLLVFLLFGLAAPTTAGAATRSATPATFPSVLAAAQSGDTITLANGSYQTSGATKTGMVTITPAAGASPSVWGQLGSTAQNLRFDGIKDLGLWQINAAKNIEIVNSTYTTTVEVIGATAGIVFDNDTFNNLPSGTWEGRLSIANGASGITVKNSRFGGGGCSDGINLTGSAHDVTIGPGNEFSGLKQGSCAAHVDPIQLYGAANVTVTGNYFHDNSTGIMSPDGNGSPVTVTDNVMVGDGGYPWAVVSGGGTNDRFRHNTIVGWTLEIGQSNAKRNATGQVVADSIATVTILSPQPASGVTQTNNQETGAYVGGTKPTSYAGYRLVAGSTGAGKASDGTDIGARINAPIPPPDPIPDPPAAPTCADVPECVALKAQAAQLTTDLATANSTLDTVRAQRDAANAKIAAALADLG